MLRVVQPPAPLPARRQRDMFVFLAGSIEMGTAMRWQDQIVQQLSDLPLTILNPRRDAWNPTWKQSLEDDRFVGQVQWELDGLETCDLAAFFFDPATKAPVTLLELGLFARSGKAVVCCPEGYYRKGNVDIVCRRYSVSQAASLDALAMVIRLHAQRL